MTALRTFRAAVVAVEDVHPHLRRITFGGGQLDELWMPGPDTFLYVLVATAGRDELALDDAFTFEQWLAAPEDRRPHGAYYTVRRWDPERCEAEVLFVLHGDDGPLGAWAARAEVGDPVTLWGPRTAFEPPAGTDRYLLLADETGLPAAAAIIESLPAGTPVTVLAEVTDHAARQDLPDRPDVDVTWCHRNAPAGTTPERLVHAARALRPPSATTYVWGGGESRSMTAVRKYLRHELAVPKERVSLIAYWRHRDHEHDPVDED